MCDTLQVKIDHENSHEKQQAKTQKELYLRKAEAASQRRLPQFKE